MDFRKLSSQAIVASVLLLLAFSISPFALRRAAPVVAQEGGGYDLTWHTVDGGGGQVTGGGYSLTATAGQHDTGTASGGDYFLSGGFWGGGAAQYRVYLPLVLRHHVP